MPSQNIDISGEIVLQVVQVPHIYHGHAALPLTLNHVGRPSSRLHFLHVLTFHPSISIKKLGWRQGGRFVLLRMLDADIFFLL